MADDQVMAVCGARKRGSDGTCKRPAGWGTDHPGHGRCKFHTGSTRNGRTVAAREQVSALAAAMGDGIAADPFDAILLEIRRASAEVVLFGKLAPASEEGVFVEGAFGSVAVHPAVAERQKASKRVVEYAKVALAAGIDERRVRVAEALGDQLGRILDVAATRLGLSDDQRLVLAEVVEAELLTDGDH